MRRWSTHMFFLSMNELKAKSEKVRERQMERDRGKESAGKR